MELYRRYGPAVLRKCERMLGNRPDAEDVVQTLFIDLLRAERGDVDLPYLYRAATNRCLNLMRDRRRRQELLDQHGAVLLPVGPTLEGRVLTVEVLARLTERLDEGCSEVFVYHFLDRMNQTEIAELMGITRRTVYNRLQRVQAEVEALASPVPSRPGGAP